jgi:mycothiol synthase
VDLPPPTSSRPADARASSDGEHLDVTLTGDLDDLARATVDRVTDRVRQLVDERPELELRLVADLPPERPSPLPTVIAARLGLDAFRDLLQLRRPLPVPDDHPLRRPTGAGDLPIRRFDPNHDVAAWVETNNRAFAWHPDQGGRTRDDLRAMLDEPWVDLDGFLVMDAPADRSGLAGSCWTRVHPATDDDPELGEIYAIGVDPELHGRGLGARLVLAGLDLLAERGIGTAMLYVEADNDPALGLYDRLGFAPHRRRRIATR